MRALTRSLVERLYSEREREERTVAVTSHYLPFFLFLTGRGVKEVTAAFALTKRETNREHIRSKTKIGRLFAKFAARVGNEYAQSQLVGAISFFFHSIPPSRIM